MSAAAAVATMLCLLTAAAARADEPSTREYRVKAAFIFHFLQFTDWPANAFAGEDAPIIVAIVGDDPFDGALWQALNDKRVGRRAVLLRQFAAAPPPAELLGCHLLFVSQAMGNPMGNLLQQVRGTPVLTVSDEGNFTEAGGVMRLLVEENKVRFEVNVTAAQRQQLKMSAKLLKLARLYEEPAT